MARNTALPLAFLARMAALLDEEFPAFLASLNRQALTGLRVNTLKLTPKQFQGLSPWPLSSVPWCGAGFFLGRKANAGMHPWHDAGLYYIQEPSAMAVATLLAPQPGERVLDLCAAPGGKATHVAALLNGQGLLVANEIDRQRAAVLVRNLERWGASNALVLNETPERLAQYWPNAFDKVLVDAPCSGEGMFRKNEEARHYWSESHVTGCALRQDFVLQAAGNMVRPGGLLAYATCTFAPEENEGVIWRFLQNHGDFELAELARQPGFEPGHPEWVEWPARESSPSTANRSTSQPDPQTLERTVRLWPHKVKGEGHFVAVLRRNGHGPASAWPPARPSQLSAEQQDLFRSFWQSLVARPVPGDLLLRPRRHDAVEVFALLEETPDTAGLQTPRPGLWLGTLRKGRFEPSYALALTLTPDEVPNRLDEPIGSSQITRYLQGEPLRAPGSAGWVLVCVAGFPLGWGKRSGDTIKNHYPKVLRWI